MSDSPTSNSSSVDKLSVKLEGSDNYLTWCGYIKAALLGHHFYGHVTGTSERPYGGTVKEQDEWVRRDEKAMSIIMANVAPTLINFIVDEPTAKGMWDKLAAQCRMNDMSTYVSLMRHLWSTRLQDAKSVGQHIAAMNDIRSQLSNISIGRPADVKPIGTAAVSDTTAAVALLLSVPEDVTEWAMFVRAFTASAKELTWDAVAAHMRAEANLQLQKQRDSTASHTGDATAVTAYAAKSNGSTAQRPRQKLYCTHCEKRGHIVDTCWELHPELRQHKQQTHHVVEFVTVDTSSCVAPIAHNGLIAAIEPRVGLWHVDNGASARLTGDKGWFSELHDCVPCTVTTANHGVLTCTQRGTVLLSTERSCITVHNVLFVPSLVVNLLSVHAMVKGGNRVRFTENTCTIRTKRNMLIMRAKANNSLYSIRAVQQSATVTAHAASAGTALDWLTVHERMGHLHVRAMQAMHDKQVALGLTLPTKGSMDDISKCEGCLVGKAHRLPFPAQASHRATRPLQLIHSDVCGPIEVNNNGKRYILTFIDDYSRFVWIVITTDKSGQTILTHFRRYKVWAEKYTGFQIKGIRTDGGGEYVNDQMTTYLHTMGIERQTTVAGTPQQNGVAERANRTILEAARSMLHAARLPLDYWVYAVQTAVYLRNRSASRSLNNLTPYEAWRGEKPDLSHLRVFGCRAYMWLDKGKRDSKLHPRAIPVIFVGYPTEAKAWLVQDPTDNKLHVTRDVQFIESVRGSTLLTVAAAEPTGATDSSTARAAAPADASNISTITTDVLADPDFDSDDDGETEAKQPVRPSMAAEPHSQQIADTDTRPPAANRSESSTIPPPPTDDDSKVLAVSALVAHSAASKKAKRRTTLELLKANHNSFGNRELTNDQSQAAVFAFAVSVSETIGEPRTHAEAISSPHRAQ